MSDKFDDIELILYRLTSKELTSEEAYTELTRLIEARQVEAYKLGQYDAKHGKAKE